MAGRGGLRTVFYIIDAWCLNFSCKNADNIIITIFLLLFTLTLMQIKKKCTTDVFSECIFVHVYVCFTSD